MSPTATRPPDIATLHAERDRIAATLPDAERRLDALDHGDPARFLRDGPALAAEIDAMRAALAALDRRIAARREFDALVADMRADYETESERVAGIADALVRWIPSDDDMRDAYIASAMLRRLAAELHDLTGEKFSALDAVETLYLAAADLLRNRVAPPGHKPKIPVLPQRAALDRARDLRNVLTVERNY